jgi:FAD-linked sulfhydryl oxidase
MWGVYHTQAAHFPDAPTTSQKEQMREQLTLVLYLNRERPEWDVLGEAARYNPPNVTSGRALQQWMCWLHNEQRRFLGKKPFDCTKAYQRWRELPNE